MSCQRMFLIKSKSKEIKLKTGQYVAQYSIPSKGVVKSLSPYSCCCRGNPLPCIPGLPSISNTFICTSKLLYCLAVPEAWALAEELHFKRRNNRLLLSWSCLIIPAQVIFVSRVRTADARRPVSLNTI